MNPLTVRMKISDSESLQSYLMRCAKVNGRSFHELFNLLKKNKYKLYSWDYHRLDYCPTNVINTDSLEQITHLRNSEIRNATFSNVIHTFKESGSETTCRFLNNLIRDKLHYCPICLAEKKQIKLIWKITDVTTCLIHQRLLLHKCAHCNKEIDYQEIYQVDKCPYCLHGLADNTSHHEHLEDDLVQREEWYAKNWMYLLHNQSEVQLSSNDIAIRLLFILSERAALLNKREVRGKIKEATFIHFLQCARGTRKRNSIRLQTLLSILYKHHFEIDDFLTLKVPVSFVDSLMPSRGASLSPTCIAPWCLNFGSYMSLIKTPSKNIKSRNQTLKEYLVCKECGCEYATTTQNELIERTYFISGYKILSSRDISKLTWPEKEKVFGLKKNRIQRICAYFYTRGIFTENNFKNELEMKKLQLFCDAICRGDSIFEIQHWKNWKNDDQYLKYRYHPLVIRTIVECNYQQERSTEVNLNKEFGSLVKEICEWMVSENKAITISSVSKTVGCSATTLRSKGGAIIVVKYKGIQQEESVKALRKKVLDQVIFYFDSHIGHIFSIDLFKNLEVSRTTLKKQAPELCTEIEQMRKERNYLCS